MQHLDYSAAFNEAELQARKTYPGILSRSTKRATIYSLTSRPPKEGRWDNRFLTYLYISLMHQTSIHLAPFNKFYC